MSHEKYQQFIRRMEKAQELSDKLLTNIKENQTDFENLDNAFKSLEDDYVYHFYHQSFKVFGAASQIKQAKELFERLAPDILLVFKSYYLAKWGGSYQSKALYLS